MRITTSSFTTVLLGLGFQDLTLVQAVYTGTWVTGTVGISLDNACGDSTFNIEKSSDLPLKADCLGLVNDALWGRDTALFMSRGVVPQTPQDDDSYYLRIVNGTGCAFAARLPDGGNDGTAMSWGDIQDLVRSSIDHYSTDDKYVRTSGTMECTAPQNVVDAIDAPPTGKAHPQKVSWQIYKPHDKSIKVYPA
ncbi:hypothetical protein GGS24DRAFT_508889 [Hypoxylon argillaceum]|nr:hypothetical protein GGS24DRAFT_508889 [Hypoxylon argillaceum]KAI1149885.1 hypothetical protein F4825DRAFT_468632 [Nemania diffusa]